MSNVIQLNAENSAKKYTFDCLMALDQTKNQVLALVENCFREMRKQLQDECTIAVKRVVKELKDKRE